MQAEIEAEFGEVLSEGDRALVARAADLLVRRAPNAKVAATTLSCANRILGSLRRKHGIGLDRKREPAPSGASLADILRQP